MEKVRPYLLVILACLMLGKIGITITHEHKFPSEEGDTYGRRPQVRIDVTNHDR